MTCQLIAILLFRALCAQPVPNTLHDQSWEAAAWWFSLHGESHLRAEMETPIGLLPFVLSVSHELTSGTDPDPAGWSDSRSHLPAVLRAGGRVIPFRFEIRGGSGAGPARVWLRDAAGSLILSGFGSGSCTRPSILPRHFLRHGEWQSLPLRVAQAPSPDERFAAIDGAGPDAQFTGLWLVSAEAPSGGTTVVIREGRPVIVEVAVADGETLTCEGRVDRDLLRASYFDGTRAILFHAQLQYDGSLAGEWWDSRRGVVAFTGERE